MEGNGNNDNEDITFLSNKSTNIDLSLSMPSRFEIVEKLAKKPTRLIGTKTIGKVLHENDTYSHQTFKTTKYK